MGNDETTTIKITYNGIIRELKIKTNITIEELIKQFIKKYLDDKYDLKNFTLIMNGEICSFENTIETYKNEIKNNFIFILRYNGNENEYDIDRDKIVLECLTEEEEVTNNLDMEINIIFFKIERNQFINNNDLDLHGLLKLCLLKEIANSDDINNEIIKKLPSNLSWVMAILKNGKINYENVQEGILEILKKINGRNIINFSKYVDEIITLNSINKYLFPYLNDSRNDIQYIQNCLGKYVEYSKKFEEEFERAKRDSVFEYSIISSAIIERENIEQFKREREKCPNRIDRVLFHGTSHDSISKILTDLFKVGRCNQHGTGIYFTEDLDSCWIYGSEKNKNINDNHRNLNIPQVGENFSFIASAIYYDENGFERVKGSERDPKKNQINYALAGMNELETIIDKKPDKSKFFGTEYVINDKTNQILPFMSFKLKRDEYCIIWRDTNFSPNPVYNNEFDDIFKNFLKERMEYINKMAKYNVYCCETTEEALNLIKRKKYNKIILISNIGSDLGGKKFIEEARKIIKNEVVVLFNAYSIYHLDWVKNYKNALFSNIPKFYEQYLDCFYDKTEDESKTAIKDLKNCIENYYDVKFNFDEKFLDYPYTKNNNYKEFKDLRF